MKILKVAAIIYSKKEFEWAVFSTILVAFATLCILFTGISMWTDEAASLRFAHEPLQHLWSDWMVCETNPPLYYTLLKFWIFLFGESDFALRSLSILLATVGLGVLYILTRQAGHKTPALLAMTLLALSLPHLNYSLQVRGYILAQTLAMTSLLTTLYFFETSTDAKKRRLWLLAYTTSTTLALYTHTTMISLPIIINIFFLGWAWRNWKTNRLLALEWIVSQVFILVLWAWWAHVTWLQLSLGAGNISWISKVGLKEAWWIVRDAYAPIVPTANLVALVFLGIAAYGTYTLRTRSAFLFGIAGFGLPLLIFIANLFTPIMLVRTILWGIGPFLAILSLGICAMPRRSWAITLAVTTILLSIFGILSKKDMLQTEPWRQLVTQISARDPDAVVVTANTSLFLLQRYCQKPLCNLTIVGDRKNPSEIESDDIKKYLNSSDFKFMLQRKNSVYIVERKQNLVKSDNFSIAAEQSEVIKIKGDWLNLLAVTRWTKRH